MKKLLVVLLALTFVFVMASVTLAVVTSSVDGKVEWTLDNANQMGGTDDGKIIFDLGKDFGEGYSAGLSIFADPDNAPTVGWNCDGWIQMVKDFGTLKFQTGGLGGNAANELGVGYDMDGNAGVQFTSTSLVEGLNLTAVLNDEAYVGSPEPKEDGNYYNYLLKGVYTADALTIGAGYQAHTIPASLGAVPGGSTKNDAMAVWAGYKMSDALSFGLEYASRPNVDGFDGTNVVTGSTAILLKADYTAAPLTISGKVLMTTGRFWLIDPDDMGTTSAWNLFKGGIKIGAGSDPKDMTGVAGTAIKIDAGYQITDAIKVTATVENILDGANIFGFKLVPEALLSYRLGVTDQLSEKLSAEAWYAAYDVNTEIGAKATYTFVAGLVGSLELKSANDGVKDADGNDAVNTYTVKLTATL